MPARDYSSTPSENTSIGGLNAAEGNPAANQNNITRQLAADLRLLADEIDALPSGLPLAGGTVTGEILRSGAGAIPYMQNAAFSTMPIAAVTEGSARPSGAKLIFYYT